MAASLEEPELPGAPQHKPPPPRQPGSPAHPLTVKPSPGSRPVDSSHAESTPKSLVAATFGRFPATTATGWSGVVLGWIAAGTLATRPIADTTAEELWADGAIRWPAAAIAAIIAWRLRDRLPISLFGMPKAPKWFPWATVLLTFVVLIRVSVVSQFWDRPGLASAIFFSEMSVGFLEELAFRSLIFPGLILGFGTSRAGVRKAALLSCALFGLVHIFGGLPLTLVTLFFGAVFLLVALELRSVWPAAVLHGLFDVGVNGATAGNADDWNETLMGFANVALLIGGLVALVMLGFWKNWPVADDETILGSDGRS